MGLLRKEGQIRMNTPEKLLRRLEDIGQELSQRPGALALIGLGSVGLERERLDAFSDLDFFVIVQAGYKAQYLDDLCWLTQPAPAAFSFANTPDGCKFLYEDGVFCEFAVFEESELQQAVFAPGRVVWKAAGVSEQIAIPQRAHLPGPPPAVEWLIGEALTNVYVGLLRDLRGEKLSAMRFIQVYAVDRTLELAERSEPTAGAAADGFNRERRFEQRVPALAGRLPAFAQGYARNRESALAVLAYLDEHFAVHPAMKQAILKLCGLAR